MPTVEKDLVIVSGTDAGDYLQTQLTQDVLGLAVGDSAWSFLLKPKSEIIALMQVSRAADQEYILEMESGWGDTVRDTIDEFLGRMDVSFEQTTGEFDLPDENDRIAAGWPRMGREIDGQVTPAMTGIVSDTIAFEKGCYTGQEFVARVHHRDAAPPKRLVRLAFDGAAKVKDGDQIVVDGEEVGVVTSVATGVALGYLKRGCQVPSDGAVGDVPVELSATRLS
jgi:folate-binding protein YgfZ